MYLMSHKLVVVCIWVVIILHFSSELKSAGAWDWGGGGGWGVRDQCTMKKSKFSTTTKN